MVVFDSILNADKKSALKNFGFGQLNVIFCPDMRHHIVGTIPIPLIQFQNHFYDIPFHFHDLVFFTARLKTTTSMLRSQHNKPTMPIPEVFKFGIEGHDIFFLYILDNIKAIRLVP